MSERKHDAEAFISVLEQRLGRENAIRRFESRTQGLPPVFVLIYRNRPRRGFTTGVTYGLSAATHPTWVDGTCELVVSLKTRDESWAMAAAFFAESFRGEKSFTYGSLFTLDEPVSSESAMSGFFVFACPLPRELPSPIHLPSKTVHFKGLYPLYPGEIALYRDVGLEAFWHLSGYDPFRVTRPDLSRGA